MAAFDGKVCTAGVTPLYVHTLANSAETSFVMGRGWRGPVKSFGHRVYVSARGGVAVSWYLRDGLKYVLETKQHTHEELAFLAEGI